MDVVNMTLVDKEEEEIWDLFVGFPHGTLRLSPGEHEIFYDDIPGGYSILVEGALKPDQVLFATGGGYYPQPEIYYKEYEEFYEHRVGAILSFSAASVPEPTTMLLLGSGLVGLAVIGRKRFKK